MNNSERDDRATISFWCTPEERDILTEMAREADMSRGAFIRMKIGINTTKGLRFQTNRFTDPALRKR